MRKFRSFIFLLPICGTILFVTLYFVASLYYPGGSQADANSIGFSWKNNYWCNLLADKAINGRNNPSKSIAVAGKILLAVSMSFFWYLFPAFVKIPKNEKGIFQVSGILSMVLSLFIATSKHDSIISIAGISGIVALVGTFIGLYKLGWKKLLIWGYLNLVLVIMNNLLYYFTSRQILPVVQKITFALFLIWICVICLTIFKMQNRFSISTSKKYLKRKFFLVFLLVLSEVAIAQIKVHPSGKYLVEAKSGKPFFWLGDTGWELFHRLKREDVIHYLDKRKSQGFNVIQAVALAENNGLITPNRYGDVPFINLDPTNWAETPGSDPNNNDKYDYWDNVDFVIKEAAKRNLYVGLLPTWGDKVAHLWGDGPMIFNEKNAYLYTKKLALRYKNQWNIIWILGGDRPGVYERNGKKFDDRPIWRAAAKGIQDVYGKDVFITYHPGGSADGSSAWFHKDAWLDMNALQSGHGSRQYPIWDYIRNDLKLKPLKPTMDMEPCYEDHPVNPWDGKWTRDGRGFFSSLEIRARMYRGVFAGGCGTTYGHHSVWQFLDTALYKPIYTGDIAIHWKEALNKDVANQIHHLKNLMLSHKDLNRIDDSLLIVSDRGSNFSDLVITTKNVSCSYAMIYLPQAKPVTVNIGRLQAGKKSARWLSPVSGKFIPVKEKIAAREQVFTPPSAQHEDWVLLIEQK